MKADIVYEPRGGEAMFALFKMPSMVQMKWKNLQIDLQCETCKIHQPL